MAFTSRFLSRSTYRQLYGGRTMIQPEQTILVRAYTKEAPPKAPKDAPPKAPQEAPPKNNLPILQGDDMLKKIFLDMLNKYKTAIGVLTTEKITIDPDDPAAVSRYAKVMKMVREKADCFSESQRIKYTIETSTKNIQDARTYLLQLQEIRIKRGLADNLGAEAMMMDALEKVEKELGKPLMRDDKKGMDLMKAEFEKINQKLGIRKEDLPKYEEELEHKISKAQLEELKKDALEAMETQKKREEFKDEPMPNVKDLDIRNFL